MSCKGKGKSSIVTDLVMSEKFGLEWIYFDYQRIHDIMLAIEISNKQSETNASTNRTSTANGR